jgi:uncharacterized membrane protein
MNWEYLHLMSHPFAIVLPIAGAAVGLAGWAARREALERWGVLAVLLGGIAAVPSYFTGIAAADDITQRIFVTPSVVQTHRTWATWAAVALITAAIFAGYSIVQPHERRLRRFVLLVAAGAALLTGFAAWRGGMIEHGETPTGAPAATPAEAPAENPGGNPDADSDPTNPAPGEEARPLP